MENTKMRKRIQSTLWKPVWNRTRWESLVLNSQRIFGEKKLSFESAVTTRAVEIAMEMSQMLNSFEETVVERDERSAQSKIRVK
jgi:hypothetical protein